LFALPITHSFSQPKSSLSSPKKKQRSQEEKRNDATIENDDDNDVFAEKFLPKNKRMIHPAEHTVSAKQVLKKLSPDDLVSTSAVCLHNLNHENLPSVCFMCLRQLEVPERVLIVPDSMESSTNRGGKKKEITNEARLAIAKIVGEKPLDQLSVAYFFATSCPRAALCGVHAHDFLCGLADHHRIKRFIFPLVEQCKLICANASDDPHDKEGCAYPHGPTKQWFKGDSHSTDSVLCFNCYTERSRTRRNLKEEYGLPKNLVLKNAGRITGDRLQRLSLVYKATGENKKIIEDLVQCKLSTPFFKGIKIFKADDLAAMAKRFEEDEDEAKKHLKQRIDHYARVDKTIRSVIEGTFSSDLPAAASSSGRKKSRKTHQDEANEEAEEEEEEEHEEEVVEQPAQGGNEESTHTGLSFLEQFVAEADGESQQQQLQVVADPAVHIIKKDVSSGALLPPGSRKPGYIRIEVKYGVETDPAFIQARERFVAVIYELENKRVQELMEKQKADRRMEKKRLRKTDPEACSEASEPEDERAVALNLSCSQEEKEAKGNGRCKVLTCTNPGHGHKRKKIAKKQPRVATEEEDDFAPAAVTDKSTSAPDEPATPVVVADTPAPVKPPSPSPLTTLADVISISDTSDSESSIFETRKRSKNPNQRDRKLIKENLSRKSDIMSESEDHSERRRKLARKPDATAKSLKKSAASRK
jgi:hypothetical protein